AARTRTGWIECPGSWLRYGSADRRISGFAEASRDGCGSVACNAATGTQSPAGTALDSVITGELRTRGRVRSSHRLGFALSHSQSRARWDSGAGAVDHAARWPDRTHRWR